MKEYPIEYRLRVNKTFNETFRVAYDLLASVYAHERPGDNLPYLAVRNAQEAFNVPTGKVESNLGDFTHKVWRRWHQVNNRESSVDLQAPSNCLMYGIWHLLMGVEKYNFGKLEDAQWFADKAEITLKDIEARCLMSAAR
ncbi:MAG: hypothetical protein WC437_01730 [Patescibacteria group bacterium]|jgi:hypothetical protein|nr:hypothetical protein [Patescibacteria group bacterium]